MSRLALLWLALTCVSGCSDSASPTAPRPEPDPEPEPQPAAIASITMSQSEASLDVGETLQLDAAVRDAAGDVVDDAAVQWSTSAPAVASVSDAGLVTALTPGEALIQATAGGKSGSAAVEVAGAAPQPPGARGRIAYVKDDAIHTIAADGSAHAVVWSLPDTLYRITGLSWRPDGSEIAFASDHEMAVSLYERDLYAIRPDGSGLRKLTNGPLHEELAGLPQGTVTVTVQNLTFDAGPYFVYVTGAEEPQMISPGPAGSTRVTFSDVADLGDGVHQPVVVINGIHRWWNAAAAPDVEAGGSVDAGTVSISPNPVEHFGADVPFWRSDGSAVGFIGLPTCLLQYVPSGPSVGPDYRPLIDADEWGTICGVDWSPAPELADQLLIADSRDFTLEGVTHIHRVEEGSSTRNDPLLTLDGYVQVVDLRWIPDGSGFLVARHDGLLDMDVNLYEYRFATGELTQVTDFAGEYVRSFSISPDGEWIAFERITGGDPYELAYLESDLWVMRRDGSEARRLVPGARLPAW